MACSTANQCKIHREQAQQHCVRQSIGTAKPGGLLTGCFSALSWLWHLQASACINMHDVDDLQMGWQVPDSSSRCISMQLCYVQPSLTAGICNCPCTRGKECQRVSIRCGLLCVLLWPPEPTAGWSQKRALRHVLSQKSREVSLQGNERQLDRAVWTSCLRCHLHPHLQKHQLRGHGAALLLLQFDVLCPSSLLSWFWAT